MKPQLSIPKKGTCDHVIKIILQYQPSYVNKSVENVEQNDIIQEGETQEQMTSSWRVMSFFFVVFVLPTLLISVPLYARYQLYPAHNFLTTDGDIFSLHDTVNSFWCQGQKITANGSFEAFQTKTPILQKSNRRESVVLSRLRLQHDDAEEWGFYLVKGSSFVFSSCARWPGGTLVVVKGEENLRKCFYREDRLKEELEDAQKKAARTPHYQKPLENTDSDLADIIENSQNNGGEVFDDLAITEEDLVLASSSTQKNSNNYHPNILKRRKRADSPSIGSFPRLETFRTPIDTYKFNDTFDVTAGNSSFSSSEEFLRQCTNTLASIELNPYPNCHQELSFSKNSPDRWKFKVNESDYYFFIFASDNTIEDNTIHFKLMLKRALFNTTNHISYCANSTECFFAFPFMSPSGVVLDVKGSYESVSRLEDLNSYEVRSECQPRFIVYTVLILLVPFIIVLFAFR